MLKLAIVGLGGMGRAHLGNMIRLSDKKTIIELVALCDINPKKLENEKVDFNLDMGKDDFDFNRFNCYTDIDEMLEKEQLDLVMLALPTYLHCKATVKCLKAGINVFCEKPMALNAEECQLMIDTAKETGKKLMIGQCLRFWEEYAIAKKFVENGELGKPLSAYFFRGGGGAPAWSYNNWLRKRELGGGCLHDQHVHDVDMINYLFGMPKAVSSIGKIAIPGSGHDMVSTNYIYDNNLVVNAQDDWFLPGAPFQMAYRICFEKGSIVFDFSKVFKVSNAKGEDITPELTKKNAYVEEIKYFADLIINDKENTINNPYDSLNTVKIAVAEAKSADKNGEPVII